jgi:hypothetical protein
MGFNYASINDVRMWLAGLDVSDMPSSLDLIIEQAYLPWAKRQVDMFIGENLDLTTVSEYCDGNGRFELILRHRNVSFVRKCTLNLIPSMQWYDFKRWYHLNTVDQTGIKIAEEGGVAPILSSAVTPYVFAESDPVPDDLKGVTPTGTFSATEAQYGKSDLFIDCRSGFLTIPPRIMYLENQAIPFWNYTWLRGVGNVHISYDYGYKTIDQVPAEIRTACAQFVAAAVLYSKGQFAGGGMTSFSLGGMSRSFGENEFSGHIKNYLETAKFLLMPHKRIRV